MGKVSRNLETEEDQRFWRHIYNTAEEVKAWPGWKRGDNKPAALNWYGRNKKWTSGLKTILKQKGTFRTIRLGSGYADNLNPGQRISISISYKETEPNIVCEAVVVRVSKTFFAALSDSDLIDNIGAKKLDDALKDMSSVYGKGSIDLYNSVVSVIDLKGV